MLFRSDKSTLKITIDRRKCELCGNCVNVYPSKTVKIFGTVMNVEQVMSIVEQDDLFYVSSGGGLTLSGGDPLSVHGIQVDPSKIL